MKLFALFVMLFSSLLLADELKYAKVGTEDGSPYLLFENIKSEKFNDTFNLKVYVKKGKDNIVYLPELNECKIAFNPTGYCLVTGQLDLSTGDFLLIEKKHVVQAVESGEDNEIYLPATRTRHYAYTLNVGYKDADKIHNYESVSTQEYNALLSELFSQKSSDISVWIGY
jgi:hypothetical protein